MKEKSATLRPRWEGLGKKRDQNSPHTMNSLGANGGLWFPKAQKVDIVKSGGSLIEAESPKTWRADPVYLRASESRPNPIY